MERLMFTLTLLVQAMGTNIEIHRTVSESLQYTIGAQILSIGFRNLQPTNGGRSAALQPM